MAIDYTKLTNDLRDAGQAGAAALRANPEDGGTCNFDTCLLQLPRANEPRMEACGRESGTRVSKMGKWISTSGWWWVHLEVGGQANSRTRAMEAAKNVLKERGWKVSGWYHAD